MLCCRKKSKTASKMNACRFIIGIVAVFLILCNISCSAHSGRTDAYGGHYNRSTGEYHFHHGKPEHSHPDGVCPYKAKNEKSEFNHDIYLYVAIGIIAVPFGVIFICSIITEIRTRKSKRKYSKQIFRNSFWLYRTISSGISSLRSDQGIINDLFYAEFASRTEPDICIIKYSIRCRLLFYASDSCIYICQTFSM